VRQSPLIPLIEAAANVVVGYRVAPWRRNAGHCIPAIRVAGQP
jgi:hypothetical protein